MIPRELSAKTVRASASPLVEPTKGSFEVIAGFHGIRVHPREQPGQNIMKTTNQKGLNTLTSQLVLSTLAHRSRGTIGP